MKRDKVLRLLIKLQNVALESLSKSPTEAAIAAARMQELMFKYKIDRAEFDLDEGLDGMTSENVMCEDKVKLSKWQAVLADGVASTNFCRAVFAPSSRGRKAQMQILGKNDDVTCVSYMYKYLVNEISRMTELEYEAGIKFGLMDTSSGGVRKWKSAFKWGCTTMIVERLKQQRRDDELREAQASLSLVRKVDTAVEEYVRSLYPRIKNTKGVMEGVDGAGYNAGRRAGKVVDIADHIHKRIGDQ